MTFAGIDPKAYRLVFSIQSNQVIPVLYNWQINADAVAANYGFNSIWRQYGTANDTIKTSKGSTNLLNDNNSEASELFLVLDLIIAPDGLVWVIGRFVGYAAAFEMGTIGLVHTAAVANITRIDIIANVAASIAAGSFIAVYETE
jgi:hypothetical protein